jgi:hypothetical protein
MNNLTQSGTGSRPTTEVARATHLRGEALVVVVATGLAVLVWAAARAAGVDLAVRSGSGSREVVLGSVVVTPLLVGVAATGLLRLLERRTSRALRVWTVVAMAVWAVSFLGPLSATTLGAGLVLATMHLLVGGVVVVGLRLTRAEPTRVA